MNNEIQSVKSIIRNNWKYILFLILASQIFIFLTGSIDYTNSEFSNSDFNKYIKMAEASPGINQDVIRPFVYRIIIPWIAGILPFSIFTNFEILNHIALIFLSLSIFIFFYDHNTSPKLAFVLTLAFQLNRYFFLLNTWNQFQVCDAVSLGIVFLSFSLIKRKNWFPMLIIFPVSVLIKEYVLIILPAGLFYLVISKSKKQDFIYYFIISLISISVFVLIRKVIFSEGGESLFVQYTTQVIYYSKPVLLLKRFVVPFTPFGLIPIFYYKELLKFFKEESHFFIYTLTVIGLSFFGEPERLMAPLSVVYLLFVGKIISQIIRDFVSKRSEINFYSLFLLIVFAASFYHIWGIVKLPSKEISMIFTVIVNTLMIILLLGSNKIEKIIFQNKN